MNATKLLMCSLALIAPKRPAHIVGQTVLRYDVYRTDKTEHCFEEAKRLGLKWTDDKLQWMMEVPMEMCR